VSAIAADRYPITDPDAIGTVIQAGRQGLARDGVAILEGFLTDAAVAEICEECRELEAVAHHSVTFGSPYLELPDPEAPPGHPRGWEVRSSLGAVAYDLIPTESPLRALYESDDVLEFVRLLLDRPALYRYADPLGALNIAVMSDGDELGWHFDQTDFVVSLALQSSTAGGEFVSATRIRTETDPCYDAVAGVLRTGSGPGVVSLPMRPGTLMLFEGRHSMHRVTPVTGPRPRYVALLAYDTRPDTDSSDLLKLVRYGRLPQ
jgi:hypothetical protein